MQAEGTIAPHGGELVNRVLSGEDRKEALAQVSHLQKVVLGGLEASDLELIATGAYSPLVGFMGREDYLGVLRECHLASGLAWTLPITLAVEEERAGDFREGEEVALLEGSGQVLGTMRVAEICPRDRQVEAKAVYRTADPAHPGVVELYGRGEVLLGGDILLLNRPGACPFPEYRYDPAESRAAFAQRGWRRVVGFQTRNPTHRAHEYIQKCALEMADGLFFHPLVGPTKPGDIPAEVRMESYRRLLECYYPAARTLLAVFPAAMRYAGPREAVFHALVRKNYGCTHFIVGRDHAGVGSYYGPYEAQGIFSQFRPEEIGIAPLFFEEAFYCRRCGGMASDKTCPHGVEDRIVFSGTKVREMLRRGEAPPPEVTRPEVGEVLMRGLEEGGKG